MNKRRRRSLRRRPNPQPSDSISHAAEFPVKRLVGAALLALCGAIAIYFVVSHPFKSTTPVAKVSVIAATPIPVKESSPPTTPTETDRPAAPGLAEVNQSHQEPLVSESSSYDPAPIPNATPATETAVNESDSAESKRSETDRRSVERQRRLAERKRSRLESEYQKHAISNDAYKKGQEEYKNEIEKYRTQLSGSGPNNE
jgi:hypothetical protein